MRIIFEIHPSIQTMGLGIITSFPSPCRLWNLRKFRFLLPFQIQPIGEVRQVLGLGKIPSLCLGSGIRKLLICPPHRIGSGTWKIPISSPLYRLWDLKNSEFWDWENSVKHRPQVKWRHEIWFLFIGLANKFHIELNWWWFERVMFLLHICSNLGDVSLASVQG